MNKTNYVVVTPVRNEEYLLPKTVASMVSQTCKPARWVLVDDGSSDSTPAIVESAAREHVWITAVRRPDRGFRQPAVGVVQAFYDGFKRIGPQDYSFIVKLDGDLSFAADYFERCLREFERQPALGIGGGCVCVESTGGLKVEVQTDPPFHVRGATKIYRRACWEQISPLVEAPGWDSIDEIKANMLGWQTRTFRDIKLVQLKPTGSADGVWRTWFKGGRANYVAGYHPLFMFFKCLRRAVRRPYFVAALGLITGFISGYVKRVPQVQDGDLIRYIRGQQVSALLLRPSLWR